MVQVAQGWFWIMHCCMKNLARERRYVKVGSCGGWLCASMLRLVLLLWRAVQGLASFAVTLREVGLGEPEASTKPALSDDSR